MQTKERIETEVDVLEEVNDDQRQSVASHYQVRLIESLFIDEAAPLPTEDEILEAERAVWFEELCLSAHTAKRK